MGTHPHDYSGGLDGSMVNSLTQWSEVLSTVLGDYFHLRMSEFFEQL